MSASSNNLCQGQSATLTVSGANSYSWSNSSFGNSIIVSPTITTNYSVVGQVQNGCVGAGTAAITVSVGGNFSVSGSHSVCSGKSTTLLALGGNNFTWTPSISLNNGNVSSPMASPTVNTIYTLNILNNSGGFICAETLTFGIEVKPTPTADFSYSLNPCGGGVYFTDLSSSEIKNWLWNLSSLKTSTLQNPYYFFSKGGNYLINLKTENIYGCENSTQRTLTISTPPPLIINPDSEICFGNKIQLYASGGETYSWAPSGSLDNSYITNPIATPSSNTTYSCFIHTTLSLGGNPCDFLLLTDALVDVLSSFPATLEAVPKIATIGNSCTLIYKGDPGAFVTWSASSGTLIPNTGYTLASFPEKTTSYTVIASKGTCKDTLFITVDAYTEECIDKDTFVPNTFSPNGDGENDILYVRGLKAEEIYFSVYNRWGEIVFETNEKNKGWNGYYKSNPAEFGVYGWFLKVKCINGSENFKKGNVTLIR